SRRCNRDPKLQPLALTCSAIRPSHRPTLSFDPPDTALHAAGAASKATPAEPTSIPRSVGPCRGWPPGSSASNPANQKGEVLINRDASPLGIHNSANVSPPLPSPRVITPHPA